MSTAKPTSKRTRVIVESLRDAFAPLMRADPAAFRAKYRKMASDPHAFYRGSACLFYLGRFTWDLQRFAASLALVGWQKALPEDAIRKLISRYVRSYLAQVNHYSGNADDEDFEIRLDTAHGPVLTALEAARSMRRADLLDEVTVKDSSTRRFVEDSSTRRLPRAERTRVEAAFAAYLETIPQSKRFDRELFYELRDVVGKSGFGIGSAGLPAYNILVEGYSQALDNDVVLSMKQANIPAVSRFVDTTEVDAYFDHEGHRTAVSQRALQVHTDPLLGHTQINGVGFVVSEVSPYEVDLDWAEINEPDDMRSVVDLLGRATAKIHCASDEDSQQDLVDFQVEEAIATSLKGRRNEFVSWVCDWGIAYAETVRTDHALFVDAFREGQVGIAAT